MLIKNILILFSVLLPALISGQVHDSTINENLLVIRKIKSSKRVYYSANSTIVYKVKDSTNFGIIKTIAQDSMLIDSTWVNYSDINQIINPNSRYFLKSGSIKFPIAGIAYALITSINVIINEKRLTLYREHIIPSVGLIGLGVIMWPFRTQKYRLKGRWQLIVMPS